MRRPASTAEPSHRRARMRFTDCEVTIASRIIWSSRTPAVDLTVSGVFRREKHHATGRDGLERDWI